MDKDLWIVALFLGVLLLSAALIVWMFLSLLRSELEDERRQLIVGRASLWAFTAMVGATLIEVIETAAGLSDGVPMSPFVRLTVAAVMYAVFLGWFKHKYGG